MPTWNYSATAAAYSRTCMTPPTGAQGHAALPRIAPKMEEWCVHGESHSSPQMSLIQEGFVLRTISSEVPFSKCSQMQLSSAQQAAGAAVTNESSHKKQQPSQRKFEGQGTQRHLPSLLLYPLSSRFLLSLYGKTGKKS